MTTFKDYYRVPEAARLASMSASGFLANIAEEGVLPAVWAKGYFLSPAERKPNGTFRLTTNEARLCGGEFIYPDPEYIARILEDGRCNAGLFKTDPNGEVDLWATLKGGKKPELRIEKLWVHTSDVGWAFYKLDGEMVHGVEVGDKLWHIGPLGNTQALDDLLGLEYLWRMLGRPHEPFLATDVFFRSIKPTPETVCLPSVSGVPGASKSNIGGIQAAEDGDLSDIAAGDAGGRPNTILRGEGYGLRNDPAINNAFRQEVLAAITTLEDELATVEASTSRNDISPEEALEQQQERSAELREKIARYKSNLDAGTRLDGAARSLLPTRLGQSRKAVSNAITRALKEIEAVQPDIAAHIRQYVKKGVVLKYRPPSHSPRWLLSPPTTPVKPA